MPDAPSTRLLRVLHLEDSPPDHVLAMAHLKRAGLRVQALRVDTEAAFTQALADGAPPAEGGPVADRGPVGDGADPGRPTKADLGDSGGPGTPWDVVLSDFNLPGFNGLRAQQIVQQQAQATGRLLPFILVSGEIGEDTAVAAMRNGASDYLLKNNLARLAPAVEHAIAANRDRVARLAADAELNASRQRLSELAQHLQTSVEMERAAIAREIHDDVGGSLTAIKFDLAWIGRHVDSAEVQQRVGTALETVAHAIEASQRIMHNLRPAILEQGLVPALQWMTQQFEKRNPSVACRFVTSHDAVQLPAGVPLVAYRFAQEALTNCSKHAQASRVTVDLSVSRGVLSVEVSDNGRGLSQADLAKTRSFGLRGLHERAGTVGGWVDVSSSATGTVLMLGVPLKSAREAQAFNQDDDHDPTGWGAP